jgi:hypothetical protein
LLLIIFIINLLTKDFAIGDDYHFLTFWGYLQKDRSREIYQSLIFEPFSLGRVLQSWFNLFLFPDFVENVEQLTYIRIANFFLFIILVYLLTKIIFKNASWEKQLIVVLVLLCNPATIHLLLMSYGFPIFLSIILSLVVGKMLTFKMGVSKVLISIFIFNVSILLYQPSILLVLLPLAIIKLENSRKLQLFSFDKFLIFPAFVISIFLNLIFISKIDSPRKVKSIDLTKLDLSFADTSLFPYRIIDFVYFNSTLHIFFSIFLVLSYLLFLFNSYYTNRLKHLRGWNYSYLIVLPLGLLFNFFILLSADLNDDYRKFLPGWIFTISSFVFVLYSNKIHTKFFALIGAIVSLTNLFYFHVFVVEIATKEWSNSRLVSSRILLPEASALYSKLSYDCYTEHLYTEELSGSTFLFPSSIMLVLQSQYYLHPNDVVMNPWETVFDNNVKTSSNWSQMYLDICKSR